MAQNYVSRLETGEDGEGCHRKWAGHCGGRSQWGMKRATIVRKPEGVLIGEPGTVIFAEIEVQNQTKWPWKRGCYTGLSTGTWRGECPLIVKDYPIDQEVRGMQTIKLLIPIEIPSDYKNEKDSEIQVIELPFAFFGPRAG